jgi:hypothetical protein
MLQLKDTAAAYEAEPRSTISFRKNAVTKIIYLIEKTDFC